MKKSTRTLALALAVAGLLALPAAGLASTTYGSSLENSANEGCEDMVACTLVAFTIPAHGATGSPDSSGAPVSGVITKFRVRVSTPGSGPGTVTLRLASISRAAPGADSALATSAGVGPTVTVSGAEDDSGDVPIQEFAARLPVKKGNHIAADTTNVNLIHASNGDKDTYRFAPPLVAGQGPRGSTGMDGARNEMLLQVVIEPDRDGDGFGDETQDGCPSQKSTAGPCETGPTVSGLKLAGRKQIHFRLSGAATVKLTVQRATQGRRVHGKCRKPSAGNRHNRHCTRFVRVKRLTVQGKAGDNTVNLSRKLRKGRYRVVAATVAARASAAAAAAGPSVTGEFPVSATPNGIAAGPDGNIWVVINGGAAGNQIARLTPAGDVKEFADTDLVGAGGIVAGPDGNMWVSLNDGVAKFAPSDPEGTATKFTIDKITNARGIVVGADGNLWLGSGDNVVKVPPADPATFTFTNVAGMSARGTARSGNLIWVADFGSKRMVSVTMAGVATPVPAGDAGPQGVAGGPGGQIAYGIPNVADTEVDRLVPGGTPMPTKIGATDPFGVTFAPDQAYWFAQFATSNLARLTPDGKYTQLGGLSAGSGPREIANGPGGTLWVSLQGNNKVARVSGVEPPVVVNPSDPHPGAPVVSSLKLSRSAFRKGSRTKISFGLSEPANVRLSFAAIKSGRKVGGKCKPPTSRNRHRKRCRRFVAVRTAIAVTGKAGANVVRFDGRLSRHKSLRPGRYRLTVGATDLTGHRSIALRAVFRLLPAR